MVYKQTEGHRFDDSPLRPNIKYNKAIAQRWMWPWPSRVSTSSRQCCCKLKYCWNTETDNRVKLLPGALTTTAVGPVYSQRHIHLFNITRTHLRRAINIHSRAHTQIPVVLLSLRGPIDLLRETGLLSAWPPTELDWGCKRVQADNTSVLKNDGWMTAECPEHAGHTNQSSQKLWQSVRCAARLLILHSRKWANKSLV